MSIPFTIPIATGGSFECTSPAPKVYLLTFAAPPDNRLEVAFLEAWILALDIIEYKHPKGVVITTSAIPKFYSNGLNLDQVVQTPGFMSKYLYPLFQRLLTFPMPTIALFNGHAFAGGFMVGMYHDYRFMNPAKGFLCLNEILFGAVLPAGMMSVFREKIPNPQVFRDVVLEAKRYAGPEALKEGLVDGLGELKDLLAFIKERDLTTKGASGVYGGNKAEMYRESLHILQTDKGAIGGADVAEKKNASAKEAALRRIEQWAGKQGKANL